ncbi:hypothetical protein RN001_015068 [Aquatica leii]|uniref:Uncharacterized protein n=1 Tax=Aquatica leii TaxID=1421715 RepID=A0AAN7NYR9_9COLE|nr:hypothetical protein RN001_015068 [Aquatica leii]
MKSILAIVVLLNVCFASNHIQQRQQCSGSFCNPIQALVMKYFILQFNFNQMYTDYLTNVTNCICNTTNPCIGTVYNTCINLPVGRKESCTQSIHPLIDFYIFKTKSADFNCFRQDDLNKYKQCICAGAIDQCPGTKHNTCFRSVFG